MRSFKGTGKVRYFKEGTIYRTQTNRYGGIRYT